jgi:hypothetical protein
MPERPIRSVVLALAACVACAAAQPQRQTAVRDRTPAPERVVVLPELTGSVTLNAGVTLQGSVSFDLSRSSVGYQLDGTPRGADQPRWAPARPTPMGADPVVIDGTAVVRTYAGGLGSDGAPIVVCFDVNRGDLLIHRGPSDVLAYWSSDPNQTYRKPLRAGDRPADLLLGQPGAMPDHAFSPAGAVVWDGFIGIACAVRERTATPDGEQWLATRTALVWTTDTLLASDPSPWRVAGISRPSAPLAEKTLLQHWSVSLFPADASRAVVFLADYRAPATAKDGGSLDAYTVLRTGTTISSVTGVNLIESSLAGQHCHVGGMTVAPDGRTDVYASFGDTMRANRLIRRSLAPGAPWTTTQPDPLSGINGQFALAQASPGWQPAETVWGGQLPTPAHANQLISMVPADTALSAILCGGDENGASILRLTPDGMTGGVRFDTVYQPQVTSNPEDGVLVFGLQALHPGGPYLAVQTGPGWSADREMHGRILYSPDGDGWAHLPWTGISEQCPAVFEGPNAAVSGSIIPGFFKRLGLNPDAPIQTPLALSSPRATNKLIAGDQILPAAPPPGATIQRINATDLAALGIPPPPSHLSQTFRLSFGTGSASLGRWRPTGAGTPFAGIPSSGGLSIRAWARAIGPDRGGPANTTTIALSPVAINGSNTVVGARNTGMVKLDPGAWVPITIWLDARLNGNAFYTANPGPHRIELDLSTMTTDGVANPGDLLLCFESIALGAPSLGGAGAAPGAETDELAAVGFPPADEWTVYFEAFVPEHLWDARTGSIGSAARPKATIARIAGQSNATLVQIDPALGTVSLTDASGSALGPFRTIYPVRNSPFRVAVTSGPFGTRLRYSMAGMDAEEVLLPRKTSADRIVFGEGAIDLSRVLVFPERMTRAKLDLLFESPPDTAARAASDLNADGRTDPTDLHAFLAAFAARSPAADFNADTRTDWWDVQAYLTAYQADSR